MPDAHVGGSGQADRLLTLAALGMLALAAALEPSTYPHLSTGVVAAAIGLASVSLQLGAPAARGVCVLAACVVSATRTTLQWQAVMALALCFYALIGRLVPTSRPPSDWISRGRTPIGWIALVGGVTPGALVAWLFWARPDLRDLTGSALLKVPFGWLVIGGALFAVINAALEEVIWRGLLQPALASVWGARVAIGLQALSFGLQHAHGFPRGPTGICLAAAWGVMLGALRQHTQGLVAPILAHVIADATIAVLVIGYVL